jgi:hypothetical protein
LSLYHCLNFHSLFCYTGKACQCGCQGSSLQSLQEQSIDRGRCPGCQGVGG